MPACRADPGRGHRGAGRAKIAEVSAELGFSAQSNFTRFFQHQVGIPPSEYRRATSAKAGAKSVPPASGTDPKPER